MRRVVTCCLQGRPSSSSSSGSSSSHAFVVRKGERREKCGRLHEVEEETTKDGWIECDALKHLFQKQLPAFALAALLQFNAVDASFALLKGNPNANIPRSPEAALRRSTPAVNTQMIEVQQKLEEVAYLLRIPQRKQWDRMQGNILTCVDKINNNRQDILADVAETKIDEVNQTLVNIDSALKQVLRGIEYKDSGYSGKYLNAALNNVSTVELAQVRSLPYSVPRDLTKAYPILTGRAQVKFTFKKNPSSERKYLFESESEGEGKYGSIVIDLDGFSSPITAGQILKNVKNGLYDGTRINEDYNSTALITSAKKPKTSPTNNEGETTTPSNLPLEIFETGNFEPSYNRSLDVLDMEYPVLPMSIFGAVVMCHDENGDSYKSSKENFFIYKFDKSMGGLSGLSFEEGQYSVVGYVTDGADLIAQIETGDVIDKAEILNGGDRLKQPPTVASNRDNNNNEGDEKINTPSDSVIENSV